MKLINKIHGAIFSCLVVLSHSVNATVIEFDSNSTNFFENVIDNIDLSISSGTYTGSTITLSGTIDNSNGLGILSSLGDSIQIDGQGPDEVLIFNFSEQVSFVGVEFITDERNDGERNQNDFSLASVSDLQFNTLLDDIRIRNNDFIFDNEFVGTTFAIGASERNDSFTIGSISVIAVPEPSTLFIFSMGLILALRLRYSK